MKSNCLLFALFLSSLGATSQAQAPALRAKDMKHILGDWKGTLTYLDYTSNKPYTMPAEVSISLLPNRDQLAFSHVYPNEPKANNIDTVTVFRKGRRIDEEVVKKRTVRATGNTEIITEYSAPDGNDNKPATIRHTYTLGNTTFTKKKEVQFVGQKEWRVRHEYLYIRK